jgi:hypothetical protein
MAGVAGPMLRSRRGGVRFLGGLAVGEVAAGALLAAAAYLLSEVAQAALPVRARLWLVAGVCVVFGAADLANRTPHPWRQVPQRFVHRFQPGTLGIVWGFDLGLLVTTQKVASLIWAAIAACVLLSPLAAAVSIAVITVAAVLPVVALSARPSSGTNRWARFNGKIRNVRYASGGVLMVMFAVTAVHAWHG